jgi:hypothetical protein
VVLQASVEAQRRKEWTQTLALQLRDELMAAEVARLTREAFKSALAQLVAEYMAERAADRLSRAATAPSTAVAADLLDDATRELVRELLLQGEVMHRLWSTLLSQELTGIHRLCCAGHLQRWRSSRTSCSRRRRCAASQMKPLVSESMVKSMFVLKKCTSYFGLQNLLFMDRARKLRAASTQPPNQSTSQADTKRRPSR